MRYKVVGADKETGEPSTFYVEASGQAAAEQAASDLATDRGILWSSVVLEGPSPREAPGTPCLTTPVNLGESDTAEPVIRLTVDFHVPATRHDFGAAGRIGNLQAVCPYCNRDLDKKPGRKKKCPHCGQFIHVLTRPSDGEKALVTEAQAAQIAEQWFIARGGTHEGYLAAQRQLAAAKANQAAQFQEEKARLAQRFGQEPSDNDVRWSLLNQELLDHIQHRDWGFFRNTKWEMADILRREAKFTAALGTYLEICYLDLNGPSNIGGLAEDDELLTEYPPWNPKDVRAEDALSNLGFAAEIIRKANLTPVTVEEIYRKKASALHAALQMPLSPASVWPQIRDALFGEGD